MAEFFGITSLGVNLPLDGPLQTQLRYHQAGSLPREIDTCRPLMGGIVWLTSLAAW